MKIKINLEEKAAEYQSLLKKKRLEEEKEIKLLESKWGKKMLAKTKENVEKYPECFLRPDPDNPGYPICDKYSKKANCEGLLAAYKRACQQHEEKLISKAKKLAKKNECSWAIEED